MGADVDISRLGVAVVVSPDAGGHALDLAVVVVAVASARRGDDDFFQSVVGIFLGRRSADLA